jgi:hypothetical protein
VDLPIKYSSNENRTGNLNNLNAETKAKEMPPRGYNKHFIQKK